MYTYSLEQQDTVNNRVSSLETGLPRQAQPKLKVLPHLKSKLKANPAKNHATIALRAQINSNRKPAHPSAWYQAPHKATLDNASAKGEVVDYT